MKSIKHLVYLILDQDERARNSDSHLYFRVINIIAEMNNIDLYGVSVNSFLQNMNKYPFPPFESVRRTRQKVQSEHPELAASKKVQGFRREQEQIYREFARS